MEHRPLKLFLLGTIGIPLLLFVAMLVLTTSLKILPGPLASSLILTMPVLGATSFSVTVCVFFAFKRGVFLGWTGALGAVLVAIFFLSELWDNAPESSADSPYGKALLSLIVMVGVHTHILLLHIPTISGRFRWSQHAALLNDVLLVILSLVAIWTESPHSGLHLGVKITIFGLIISTLIVPLCDALARYRISSPSPTPP